MSPAHFFNIYLAETDRLFRRVTAIIGLAMSVIFGLTGPTVMLLVNVFVVGPSRQWTQDELVPQLTAEAAASAVGQGPEFMSWDAAVYFSYYGRNFMFVPILIFLLGGLIMASEFVARTTREDVLRPAPRWSLLMAKWLALVTWCVAASVILGGLSSTFGWLLCGGLEFDQLALANIDKLSGMEVAWAYFLYVWNPVAEPVFQMVTTLVTDLGFASLALCIAVLTRSVAATVASLVMVFMLQMGLSGFLMVATFEMTEQAVAAQIQWLDAEMLKSAFEWLRAIQLWQPPFIIGNCQWAPPAWQGFVTLAGITLASLGIGLARFQTMDVP
ncbi:MAG: ABC-type transport system involved in multi-copper enzyme maturation permease subunit [Kiritimatiellia bacterium]|jgi:ABC-type transport system involved in multi-copper enzyme maturation permease subunit